MKPSRFNSTMHRLVPSCFVQSRRREAPAAAASRTRQDFDQSSPQHEKISLPYETSAALWDGATDAMSRWSSYRSNSSPKRKTSNSYFADEISAGFELEV